jgi:hypothetical protein
MSPVKIVKNPEGSLQRAAMTQVSTTGHPCADVGIAIGALALGMRALSSFSVTRVQHTCTQPHCCACALNERVRVKLRTQANLWSVLFLHVTLTHSCAALCCATLHPFSCLHWQSALSKERRELQQQQQRTLLDAIPKDLSRPWEDPMPEEGERHLAAVGAWNRGNM